MKDYLKPELYLVDFSSEEITGPGDGTGTDTSNTFDDDDFVE